MEIKADEISKIIREQIGVDEFSDKNEFIRDLGVD